MEQIIDSLTDIKQFVGEHTDVLENEDYLFIYRNTTNDDIKEYLVDNGHIILNDHDYITTLKSPDKKNILVKLLEKNSVSINSQNKGKTLLDNTILNFVNEMINDIKNVNKESYYEYIIYILSKGGIGKLDVIYDIIQELDGSSIDNLTEIYTHIVDLIDLLLLYKTEVIKIDKTNELYLEMFKNMGEENIDMSDNLNKIMKENREIVSIHVMNDVDVDKKEKNNIIKISQNEKYMIYEEDNIRWVFNDEDVKKILKTKINPYTNKIVLDETIDIIKNNYKIDFLKK